MCAGHALRPADLCLTRCVVRRHVMLAIDLSASGSVLGWMVVVPQIAAVAKDEVPIDLS